ncbi:MAG: GntR family transcriptional regulator [Actinomycetia bacterium]|nr:GntR family transcriptional regulator [Actinomycetes bacterium]
MPQPPRARVVHRSMADEVAAELRRMVLAGEFEAGERLTQDRLAKTLGVSTMPVREALLRLAAEGLIIASANRSFSVASNTTDDLRDIFWMHSTLQGELARRACLHADDDLVKALTESHKRYLDVIDDIDARFDANWQFFRAVNLASHAPRLLLMIRSTLRFFPDILHNAPGSPELAGKWQHDLLRAITKREPDKAKAVSEKYARQAGELYIAALGAPASP